MSRLRTMAIGAAFATLLSACTGSGSLAGHGGTTLPPTAVRAPRATATVYFSITIPKRNMRERRPRYVSPNTQSLTVSVNGGTPQAIGLTPSSDPHCNGATPPIVCTNLSVTAPVGSDSFTFKLYENALVSGAEPPNPTLLSTYTTPTPVDIVEGTTNDLGNFATNGVPSAIALAPPLLVAPADGHRHEFALSAIVKDASGATIIAPGEYSTPIGLSVTGDPNHAVTLSATQITSPSSTGTTGVTVIYDASKALRSATISATASGASSAQSFVNPLVYLLNSSADIIVGGTSRSIVVSEAQYAGRFTISGENSSVRVVCSTATCAPPLPGGEITLTVTGLRPGTPTLRIADTNGAVAPVPLTVSLAPSFSYTGRAQTFVVPPGVTALTVRALGASGAEGGQHASGGRGGETAATVAVTPGERLDLFVGGEGGAPRGCAGGAGGFNGGAAGGGRGSHTGIGFLCHRTGAGGGGGASDVRRGRSATDLLVVAGGGGGASGLGHAAGGGGGDVVAEPGEGTHLCSGGGGATQSKGGAGGDCKLVCRDRGAAGTRHDGGDGGNASIPPIPGGGGGGGGGGYYGGGGACGTRVADSAAGGGGSSFVVKGATNVTMRRGVQRGDGFIVLSW